MGAVGPPVVLLLVPLIESVAVILGQDRLEILRCLDGPDDVTIDETFPRFLRGGVIRLVVGGTGELGLIFYCGDGRGGERVGLRGRLWCWRVPGGNRSDAVFAGSLLEIASPVG